MVFTLPPLCLSAQKPSELMCDEPLLPDTDALTQTTDSTNYTVANLTFYFLLVKINFLNWPFSEGHTARFEKIFSSFRCDVSHCVYSVGFSRALK